MNILIAGGRGQLGTALAMTAPAPVRSGRISCLGRADLDITNQDVIHDVLDSEQPDLIINAAAYTAVDRAEDPAHQDAARAVNTDGTAYLAQAAAQAEIPFIHISTDYVYGQNDATEPDGGDESDRNVGALRRRTRTATRRHPHSSAVGLWPYQVSRRPRFSGGIREYRRALRHCPNRVGLFRLGLA